MHYLKHLILGFPSESAFFETHPQKKEGVWYLQIPFYAVAALQRYAKDGQYRSSVNNRFIEPIFLLEGAPHHPLKHYNDPSAIRKHLVDAIQSGKAVWLFGERDVLDKIDIIMSEIAHDVHILKEWTFSEEPMLVELSLAGKHGTTPSLTIVKEPSWNNN